MPHRLLAAVQYLVLGGDTPDYRARPDPWTAFLDILYQHQDWVVAFVKGRGIQTNETRRCFALLPLFLLVARTVRKPLDLLELGTSGGLNLCWDRFYYMFSQGTWGSAQAGLELSGKEEAPVPGDLLTQQVEVCRRRGIDLDPVDVATRDGIRLLTSFVGNDPGRVERIQRAAAIAGRERPILIRGDYLEVLPEVLRDRAS